MKVETLTFFKDWGGWLATVVVGAIGFRNGRIDERIDLKVKPEVLHQTLGEIKTTLARMDERTIDISERVARVEGYLEAEKG
jgi:hypothetical protein